jgi:hypothetical protein
MGTAVAAAVQGFLVQAVMLAHQAPKELPGPITVHRASQAAHPSKAVEAAAALGTLLACLQLAVAPHLALVVVVVVVQKLAHQFIKAARLVGPPVILQAARVALLADQLTAQQEVPAQGRNPALAAAAALLMVQRRRRAMVGLEAHPVVVAVAAGQVL